jgi:hypothetical protein
MASRSVSTARVPPFIWCSPVRVGCTAGAQPRDERHAPLIQSHADALAPLRATDRRRRRIDLRLVGGRSASLRTRPRVALVGVPDRARGARASHVSPATGLAAPRGALVPRCIERRDPGIGHLPRGAGVDGRTAVWWQWRAHLAADVDLPGPARVPQRLRRRHAQPVSRDVPQDRLQGQDLGQCRSSARRAPRERGRGPQDPRRRRDGRILSAPRLVVLDVHARAVRSDVGFEPELGAPPHPRRGGRVWASPAN